MTRQEILRRTIALERDHWRESGQSHTGGLEAIEHHLTALALSTLEEAARAVCPAYCAAKEKVHQIPGTNRWWHVSFARDKNELPCNASPIHDLIAALEVKP